MTALKDKIVRLIAAAGPISVADYMALCLFDPEHGYYTTREPFGAAGDFVTAPEVSQMFGEMVAVWLHAAWQTLGQPEPVTLVEIGPGRGTMMKDMLRTLAKLDGAAFDRLSVAMVEASPRLREIQRATLGASAGRIRWTSDLSELPQDRPVFVAANELFDAVPVRQYVMTAEGWRERMVTLDDDGGLIFAAGAGGIDPDLLPASACDAPPGSIVEAAPARAALMQRIAARIARHGGAGLFFDYGTADWSIGDTLQAVRGHRFDPPLAHPGAADLTSHVDFSALAAVARTEGLATAVLPQGDFLLGMGLLERAGSLGANGSLALQERLRSEVERLAGPDAMGNLFKAMAVVPPGIAVQPFRLPAAP